MTESTGKQSRRPSGKPWQPGQSGNPGGRPKVLADIRLLAQQQGADAIRALAQIMADLKAPPPARVAAAQALLDRGYGRPIQTTNIRRIGSISELDRDELQAIASDAGELSDAELQTLAAVDEAPDSIRH